MIKHTDTNELVSIVSDAGDGKVVVRFPDNKLREVDYDKLRADGGVKELQAVLAKLQAKLQSKSAGAYRYKALNGLTVHNMREAGIKVKVIHYRWAYLFTSYHKVMKGSAPSFMEYFPHGANLCRAGKGKTVLRERDAEPRENQHPLYLMPSCCSNFVDFYEKGGGTHISMTLPNEEIISCESFCDSRDNFCYKLGVKMALESLHQILENRIKEFMPEDATRSERSA